MHHVRVMFGSTFYVLCHDGTVKFLAVLYKSLCLLVACSGLDPCADFVGNSTGLSAGLCWLLFAWCRLYSSRCLSLAV
jgi:hypothetical protein